MDCDRNDVMQGFQMFRPNGRRRKIDILMILKMVYSNNTRSNNLIYPSLKILSEAGEIIHHNGKNQDQLKLVC